MQHDNSKQLYRRACDLVAGGVSSQVRVHEAADVPLFFARAEGGRMWDVDGNEYVDYIMGMGPNLFGHAPGFISQRVTAQMHNGFVFAGQFEQELAVAELALGMVPIENGRLRFASSGTEIDQLAIRLMRGVTGRPKFIKFEGHYHGWADNVSYSFRPSLNAAGDPSRPAAVPESQGIDPASADNLVVCEWNDLDRLQEAFAANRGEIAGVLMEPIAGNANAIIPHEGYLAGVKSLCEEEGALLCFDEVITGFRVAAGGAAEMLGVSPHLATYGKAMAGGLPLSMLVGESSLMETIGDGTVFHGGTFNSNVLAIAAAQSALEHINAAGPGFYTDLNGRGQALMRRLASVSAACGSDLHLQGPGSFFCISFTSRESIDNWREHARYCDEEKYTRFARAMLTQGIRLASNGRMHIATTHTDEDFERTVEAARLVLPQFPAATN
jgi:glutamate-1-semialdehyde 2,1-aminomutase